MSRGTSGLEEAQREIAWNTRRYLDGRLSEPTVLAWAARLGSDRGPERDAVRLAVAYPRQPLAEPFLTAWLHVLESWTNRDDDDDLKAAEITQTVRSGADPGLVLAQIVELVTPHLTIETSPLYLARHTAPPATANDLVFSDLRTPRIYSLDEVGLGALHDADLLAELVDRIEAALIQSLHRARRLGVTALRSANRVGRVFSLASDADDEERDPDLYRSGFAPLTRLFSEAFDRLIDADLDAALLRAGRLAVLPWPLTRRLWAAAARRGDFIGGAVIGRWLMSQDDDAFWSTSQFPEVAELRAVRFGDLDQDQQVQIEARLLKRPQAKLFGPKLAKDVRERLRDEAAAAELRRIGAAGHPLSPAARDWLQSLPTPTPKTATALTDDLYETDRYFPDTPTPIYALADDAALIERLDRDLKERLYVEGRPALDYVAANSDAVFSRLSAMAEPHRFPRVWAALASTGATP